MVTKKTEQDFAVHSVVRAVLLAAIYLQLYTVQRHCTLCFPKVVEIFSVILHEDLRKLESYSYPL